MVTRVLTGDVLRARAARIRLVLTDCDGVLTDAGVYYSARGEELKRFSMRDGMGIERLRTVAGIPVGILTKERSGIVAARARCTCTSCTAAWSTSCAAPKGSRAPMGSPSTASPSSAMT